MLLGADRFRFVTYLQNVSLTPTPTPPKQTQISTSDLRLFKYISDAKERLIRTPTTTQLAPPPTPDQAPAFPLQVTAYGSGAAGSDDALQSLTHRMEGGGRGRLVGSSGAESSGFSLGLTAAAYASVKQQLPISSPSNPQWNEPWDALPHAQADQLLSEADKQLPSSSSSKKRRRGQSSRLPAWWLASAYVFLNIVSTCGIVFANKLVLSTYAFAFPVALTLLHALFTAAGMELMCRGGLFARKRAPVAQTLPVALAYVGSIVLSNWSIHLNTVRCGLRGGVWVISRQG